MKGKMQSAAARQLSFALAGTCSQGASGIFSRVAKYMVVLGKEYSDYPGEHFVRHRYDMQQFFAALDYVLPGSPAIMDCVGCCDL